MNKYISICFLLILVSCRENVPIEKVFIPKAKVRERSEKYILDSIRLFVYGDFDGDETVDTLREYIYFKVMGEGIENPFYNGWDNTNKILGDEEHPYIVLVSNNNIDTCHIRYGMGLYCLFNIGDNNSDGKDELATVVTYGDEKNLNYCSIYSLCGKKWEVIREFSVDENVFEKQDSVY